MKIKPYYEEPGITIYCADCCKILPHLELVDLVLTDPPYGIDFKPKNKKWDGSEGHFEKIINDNKDDFCLKWFEKIRKICKDFVIFGGNNFIEYIPNKYGWLVWDKRLSEKSDKIFGSPFELAITNLVKKYKMYRIYSAGVINPDSIKGNNEPRFHPTQKPVKLFKRILLDFSNKNDMILDPFMGSGTTLVAAKQLGRKAIGIEIEKKHCDTTIKRLHKTAPLDIVNYKGKKIGLFF